MAIILGKRPIIETKEYEDYAIGLSLPIQISNVAFKQNYTEIEQLKTNIKNLLLTKRGERLMNPLFGTGVSAGNILNPLFKVAEQLNIPTYGSPTTSDQSLMPCISVKIGPGDSARSHMADEYIFVDELQQAPARYKEILLALGTLI